MEFRLTGPEFPGARETLAGFMKIGDEGFNEAFLRKSLESVPGRKLFDAYSLAFFHRLRIPESEEEIIRELLERSKPENELAKQPLASVNVMQLLLETPAAIAKVVRRELHCARPTKRHGTIGPTAKPMVCSILSVNG